MADNYARLKDKLIELPNEMEYDVFVPIAYSSADNFEFTSGSLRSNSRNKDAPLAFMPGKLVHTNELLVHLGDHWFAQRSAKQSSQIAERKLEKCERQLVELEKSEKLITDWLASIDELKGDRERLVEIHEEYDEDEERRWREKHRESVRKQKEKERLEREAAKSEQNTAVLSTITERIVERDPVNELSKLSINDQSTAKPISKFKQQMLNKKKG